MAAFFCKFSKINYDSFLPVLAGSVYAIRLFWKGYLNRIREPFGLPLF